MKCPLAERQYRPTIDQNTPIRSFTQDGGNQADRREHSARIPAPFGIAQASAIDLLSPEGEHLSISLSAVLRMYFVRNFSEPPDCGRKAFLSRPKLPGLWVRMTFRDGDTLEGILDNDLLDVLDNGLLITPPDFSGNCHRIYVPRSALAGFTVLGVVGAARPRRPAPRVTESAPGVQRTLFEEPEH